MTLQLPREDPGPKRFAREKEQILTQFILHHEIQESEVVELAERLDRALGRALELHAGQVRKTGEEYIWHPVRTAMEVSRYGRIVDWATVEAALLHDTLEDTPYTDEQIRREFPEAADLVAALTKIKDSRVLTYQRLFRYVLQDIRVLLVKLADRLDNLDSLTVFKREKQERIARESAEMYANICRRLCMLDLAERLTEKIGPILYPEEHEAFLKAQEDLRLGWSRPLEELRAKMADIFPGDLEARIEFSWSRFRPGVPPITENLFRVRIITATTEDAYRALGRVHIAFRALPGRFSDTMSTPMKNGFRALETQVSYQGRILSFYITSRSADRFNRLGLLSMDITSPEFNLEYLDDLREFLQNDDMDIQDFLRFHRPDSIQVTSPRGDVFSLEEGATALDFAFAVHEHLGLRALGARVNGEEVPLGTVLRPGDRVEIIPAEGPVADDRYLAWARSRKALSSLRRYMRWKEAERAAATGRQWYMDAARARGIQEDEAERRARERAEATGRATVQEVYRRVCLGEENIDQILGEPDETGRKRSLFRRLRGGGGAEPRKVRRYNFEDPHIRFCPSCAPVEGDDIRGVPEAGRLVVHRTQCPLLPRAGTLPLRWEKGRRGDLRDPGTLELEMHIQDGPGVLYSLLVPFKELGLDIEEIRLPQGNDILTVRFRPGSDRVMNRLIRALRRHEFLKEIRVFRAVEPGDEGRAPGPPRT